MKSYRDDYFNDTHIESAKLNFNVAFGVTEYDNSSEYLEDPTIGTMKAYYRSWGEGIDGVAVKEVPIRRCEMADFGLNDKGEKISHQSKTVLTEEESRSDTKPTFFPVKDNQVYYLKTYGSKMHCIDEKIELHGDYNTRNA